MRISRKAFNPSTQGAGQADLCECKAEFEASIIYKPMNSRTAKAVTEKPFLSGKKQIEKEKNSQA